MEEQSPQLNLFEFDEGVTGVFQIFPAEAAEGPLRDWVELTGGLLIPADEDDPYKIVIIDFDWYLRAKKVEIPKSFPVEVDCFSPFFIYDSYRNQHVEDLNEYRIGASKFTDYDANDVLKRKTSWADLSKPTMARTQEKMGEKSKEHMSPSKNLPRVNGSPTKNKKTAKENNNGRNRDNSINASVVGDQRQARSAEQSEDSSDAESISESACRASHNSSSNMSSVKHLYSAAEDQAILEFISKNDLYAYTGGNDMWMKMAKECTELSGRTYQSLKERFRRRIEPKLDSFKISAAVKRKFQLAKEERNRGRRRPLQS